MSRKFPFTSLLALMAIAMLTVSVAAQEQDPQERSGARTPHTTRPQAGDDLTKLFATKMFLGNHAEIELSQMAVQKSANEEVKQFAQTLIKDHKMLNEKLTAFVPQHVMQKVKASGDTRHSQADPSADRPGETAPETREDQFAEQQPDRDEVQEADPATQQDDRTTALRPDYEGAPVVDKLCEITIEACNNKLTATKEMLNQYSGQDFDMGFIGTQISCHVEMLSQLKAIEDVGTPEFQQLVGNAKTSVEQHLKTAKALAKKLEDDRKASNR
jgi:predicted outer membrane protein